MKKRSSSKTILKAFAVSSAVVLTTSIAGCGTASQAEKTSTKPKERIIGSTSAIAKNQTTYANGERKPNIIYIVLDDIGFSDIGAYGSEIKTPNIDQLAADGLRYNNFNATPLSSPTRASLLTGRENNSVGMGLVANVSLGPDRPNMQGGVTDAAGTVAEILKENDYNTFGVGKWHIAPVYTVTPAGPYDYWPLSKGFEKYYGFMDGETSQFAPQLVNGNELIDVPKTEDYNLNDDLLAHAKKYITDQVSIYPDKPFFMNYAFGTGHSPIQVPEEYIDMYDGVYDKGWDYIREERFKRQKELGIIPENTTLAPSDPTVKKWDSLTADQKKLYIRFMEAYAGYMTQADEEVGKLVSYLKEIGQYDNTMIVLLGDNGATRDGGPDGTDSFFSSLTAGRVPTTEELMPKYNLIGGPEMQALYPKGWAQASNTPFNTYKGSVYAGALRNPLIISWPKGITDKGGIRTQYVHVTDITPTVLDVLEYEVPEVIDGVEQMPMYGISMASTFYDANAPEVRKTAITYFQPNRAIYHEGWKAISIHKNGTSFDDDVWELYHVSEDYSESKNLADREPDKLAELQELFMSEAEKYNMLPLKESSPTDMGYIKEDSAANRDNFKYYPGTGMVTPNAAPPINTSNFTITVPVTRENGSKSGVLVAMGDEIGGYTLYIKENKLTFLYNKFDTISKITSNKNVPLGKSEVKIDFKRTSMAGGIGTLYINGQKVGEGEIQTTPLVTIEGMSIGKDALNPVAKEYKKLGEFAFSGKFDYVQFDVTKFIPGAVH
ncbi:arylsulfatase [Robertmurraya korlensis]|uniref:arylsulfatase n=1 Tax=Robertmurraya korlensis TaxID=519977 RepID=UPI0008270EC2|nr:arylsulfatase [Robertmurraya korlensis]